MIPKPIKIKKSPRPLKQRGKKAEARATDRRALEKRSPPNHEGYYKCYIGGEMTAQVDLEHILDSSTHPELFRDPRNHKWACNSHNLLKKRGALSRSEFDNVEKAVKEVLNGAKNEYQMAAERHVSMRTQE